MRTLIIGYGEIGKSLGEVLKKFHPTFASDPTIDFMEEEGQFDIIHICFPYSKDFVKEVKKYQRLHRPRFTVIHSTVPIGTSRKCNALHSPITGIHPHLEESLKTFKKFIGGENSGEVCQYFRRAGITVYPTDKQETTEMMKMLSTTFYGVCIEYTKEVKELCDKNKIPFEMWTLWTDNYNEGYKKLGYPEFTRPNLIPIQKKIGGHCVLGNLSLIKTKFSEFIKKLNEK